MTKKDDEERLKRAEEHSQEVEGALNQMLESTIRESALPNAVAWTAVVVGAFALNLLLLLAVTGG